MPVFERYDVRLKVSVFVGLGRTWWTGSTRAAQLVAACGISSLAVYEEGIGGA